MSKNLKYFMREAAEVEKVVTVPAPESFKDENGKVIQLEVKVLSSERIRAINEGYHTHTVALDKKGNPYINGGNVVFRDERDNAKATRHILVEALQYPKLDDPELMKYYNCVDITQMPEKVFSRADWLRLWPRQDAHHPDGSGPGCLQCGARPQRLRRDQR